MIKSAIITVFAYCCLSGGSVSTSADEPKKQPEWISTEELQSAMFPPGGWKIDFNTLDQYFWLLGAPRDHSGIPIMPFWPASVELLFDGETNVVAEVPPRYLEVVLDRRLQSDDAAAREATNIWLRQSTILYFAGFRMSKHKDISYAPWIQPEQLRKINGVVDHYLSRLKPMKIQASQFGVAKEIVCADTALFDIMGKLGDREKTTIFRYWGTYNSYKTIVPAYFIYPLYWNWVPSGEDSDNTPAFFAYQPYLNSDVSESYMAHLIGGTLPELEDDKVRLWCRDVYLSFLAGKLLFENKLCPIKDCNQQAFLDSAVQEWWVRARKQQVEEREGAKR
jgi:hypothetical protein